MSDEPLEIAPEITVDRRVRFGKPVVKGTRVPITTVLGQLAAGASYDEISREYGITEHQIRAVIGYAATVISQETIRAR